MPSKKQDKITHEEILAAIKDSFTDFEGRFDQRFEKVDKRFVGIDQRFERIENKLFEHDERFERIEERLDKTLTREEYIADSEKMMTILQKLDQERIFTVDWVKRVESENKKHGVSIQIHDKLLQKVKVKLNIA